MLVMLNGLCVNSSKTLNISLIFEFARPTVQEEANISGMYGDLKFK